MELILNDSSAFEIIDEDPTLKKEEQLLRILNKMKMRNFITPQEFNRFKPKGSRPARIYGLPKTHKSGVPLRPIVSGIGSFNFGIGKLLARRLSHLRTSNNSLKDTFSFIEFIRKLPPEMADYRMISFDVTSLFTKVPLKYTIDIILDKFADTEQIKSILNSFHIDIQFTSVLEENVLSVENLQPHLIDGLWLQQVIGKGYGEPAEACLKTQK
ncbi:unnamed protein product, partial [Rotaria sp. Silwood1]